MCSGQEWLRSANCMFIVNVFSLILFFVFQGWFSPGQVFVLDEYCARYGVRGCHRHLCYLKDLMDFSDNNALVDPTLLHYSYAFCASHVHGNRYYSRFTNAGLYCATFDWHSIYIYAFGFNPKRLPQHSRYTFGSVHAIPGNQTHDHGNASAGLCKKNRKTIQNIFKHWGWFGCPLAS